jgi:GNAT superfamily N-acetyltransferase
MSLTLSEIAKHPEITTWNITLPEGKGLLLRPLVAQDVDLLAHFLEGLSPRTRDFHSYPSYDMKEARELCDAINRYDKLRFVLMSENGKRIVGIFEFSFGMPEGDKQRFLKYHLQLTEKDYCRLGPCLSDDYQGKGIASNVFPYLIGIARDFDKKYIILWGGVRTDNHTGIKFYEKNGLRALGKFLNQEGKESLDMILTIPAP